MSKKQLLLDIWDSKSGLSIENVFGEAAWAKFEELQPNDVIVVVGNGPVSSLAHGDYIDSAKLVMRCNRYSQFTNSAMGRRKLGRKCYVQVICIHGREFEKKLEWCFCVTGAGITKWCWRWRIPR